MDATQSTTALLPPHLSQLLAQLSGVGPDDRVGSSAELDLDRPPATWPPEAYSVLTGAVAFSGSVDARHLPGDLARTRTRRRDLSAVAACVRALQPGGRAAIVVPEALLEGTTRGHLAVRSMLIEQNDLHAVIALGAGVFKPRVRAAILVFVKGGTTPSVWFDALHAADEIPALAVRWQQRAQPQPGGVAQGFWLEREALAASGYALGIERCRAARAADAVAPSPQQILHEIACLEAEILQGIRDLVGMLK